MSCFEFAFREASLSNHRPAWDNDKNRTYQICRERRFVGGVVFVEIFQKQGIFSAQLSKVLICT